MSDIALASAAAQAVRAVPGVADLSPGLTTPVATYGPGQRVAGIVVAHPTLEEVAVEVHVVLSESHCKLASSGDGAESGAHDPAGPGPVTEIASHIRGAVDETMRDMAPQELVRVDVYIDDLR